MGALVTLDLADDSPLLTLPWIITFGPLDDDDEWEPVVCGPYERDHALALAESVVADEDLMAVVEPVMPHTNVDDIKNAIADSQAAVDEAENEADDDVVEFDEYDDETAAYADDEDPEEEGHEHHDHDGHDHGLTAADFEADGYEAEEFGPEVEPTPPPSPEEIRAGFARIAARLTAP